MPGAARGRRHFERVYADPAADGRSRGAGLSDLFWYWLAPGPEIHQEHLEPGERYDERGPHAPGGSSRCRSARDDARRGGRAARPRRPAARAGPPWCGCAT